MKMFLPSKGVMRHVPVRVQTLQKSMQEHLRLHFNNEEASDEQVPKPPGDAVLPPATLPATPLKQAAPSEAPCPSTIDSLGAALPQVLGIYPSTIRRRILRFLYIQVCCPEPVDGCTMCSCWPATPRPLRPIATFCGVATGAAQELPVQGLPAEVHGRTARCCPGDVPSEQPLSRARHYVSPCNFWNASRRRLY